MLGDVVSGEAAPDEHQHLRLARRQPVLVGDLAAARLQVGFLGRLGRQLADGVLLPHERDEHRRQRAAKVENSFVIQDLKTFSKWPATMEHWDRMFTEYPTMVREIFNAMFSVDGKPQKPLAKRMMPIVKKRGLLKLAKEVRGALKAL